jgi:hypothetical protein
MKPPKSFRWLLALLCVIGLSLVANAYMVGKLEARDRVLTALAQADYVTVLDFARHKHGHRL